MPSEDDWIRDNVYLPPLLPAQLVPLGLFELHCTDLKNALAKKAEAICVQLLNRMSQDNQKQNQL